MKFRRNRHTANRGDLLLEVSLLEEKGDYAQAITLLKAHLPELANQAAAKSYLADLLTRSGQADEAESVLSAVSAENNRHFSLYALAALVLPLLLLIIYLTFFLLNWQDFLDRSGGIEALRSAYEEGKKSGQIHGRKPVVKNKDQLAAEKILSDAFKKRFDKPVKSQDHYIMEDSYFDRYPELYYPEGSDKNFIRLTKNLSFFTLSDFEKMLPEFLKRITLQQDPRLRFRYFLEIAYNYAMFDAIKQCNQYLRLAINQHLPEEEMRDAYLLQASIFYQDKKYQEALTELAKCREAVYFEAEMLTLLSEFQLINRQSLSAYLDIDSRLIEIMNRLDGDIYYLQSFYNELEKLRRQSSDPMILFLGGELLYGMGNLTKAKTYFEEFKKSEKRVNFISFKKAAAEMIKKIG